MTSGIKAIISHTDDSVVQDVRESLIKSGIYVDIETDPEKIEKRLSNGESRVYDILIIGDILGDRDGISITKNIRNSNCNIPVIFVVKNEAYIDRINSLGTFIKVVRYPAEIQSLPAIVRSSINDSTIFVEMGHMKKMLETIPSTIEASVTNIVEDVFRGKFNDVCSAKSSVIRRGIIDEVDIMTSPRNLTAKFKKDKIFMALIGVICTIGLFFGSTIWHNRDNCIKTENQVQNIKGQLTYISKSVDSMDKKIEAVFKDEKIKIRDLKK